ncbi:hypothetical protein SDC9_111985 [bioreactor metagenome]|uniref:Uncharacterized protein n=1 Tax=bioreactor metagenome TaxID=1076179 RepID=A0A645BPE0_9ZZZZ
MGLPDLFCRSHVSRGFHIQQIYSIPQELLPNAQWQRDKGPSPSVLGGQAAKFKLLNRFPQAEGFKQRPAPSLKGPQHRIPLMRFQRRMNYIRRYLKARFRGYVDLRFKKFHVIYLHGISCPRVLCALLAFLRPTHISPDRSGTYPYICLPACTRHSRHNIA